MTFKNVRKIFLKFKKSLSILFTSFYLFYFQVEPGEVCGCPLTDSNYKECPDNLCRVAKRKCNQHVSWERLRKGEIDLKRVHQVRIAVVSTWNTRGVFVGNIGSAQCHDQSHLSSKMEFENVTQEIIYHGWVRYMPYKKSVLISGYVKES